MYGSSDPLTNLKQGVVYVNSGDSGGSGGVGDSSSEPAVTNPLSIFVAGRWTDKVQISVMINQLKAIPGISITYDWTQDDEETDYNGKSKQAHLIMKGIKEADYIVVIMDTPDYTYHGTWAEIGAAIGLDKSILMYNPTYVGDTCIFTYHSNINIYRNFQDIKDLLTVKVFL